MITTRVCLGFVRRARGTGFNVFLALLTGVAAQVPLAAAQDCVRQDDNAPVVIVDGIRSSVSADAIDPKSIETIDMFAGPSAATLYGAAAVNGVVVVTTKKGVKSDMTGQVSGDTTCKRSTNKDNTKAKLRPFPEAQARRTAVAQADSAAAEPDSSNAGSTDKPKKK